jgi:hypothetical protein
LAPGSSSTGAITAGKEFSQTTVSPGIIGATSAGNDGTVLLRVCFNTKSSCIYIKTPTTQNKFSRITAQCGSGWAKSTKCLYSLGMSSGRCANAGIGGKPIASNSAITVLKAESSDLIPNSSCPGGQSLTYSYFSGSLAGANGTNVVPCASGVGACGQPNANGLFGNCVLNIQTICPDYQHLGYAGLGTDLVFTATPASLNPSNANQRGLSFPYTYMALTWYDPLEDCCPKDKCQKNWW